MVRFLALKRFDRRGRWSFKPFVRVGLVFALIGTAGCSLFLREEPSDRGLIAIVGFIDQTDQALGDLVAEVFWSEARRDLSDAIASTLVPSPGTRITDGWLQAQANRWHVRSFLTGTISGYRVQESRHRVWVSLTLRLIEARSGRIRWSKRLVETERIEPNDAPEDAFARAIRTAAREFTNERIPLQ